MVTQSVFAPVPQLVFDQLEQNSGDPLNQQQQPGIIDFAEFFIKESDTKIFLCSTFVER